MKCGKCQEIKEELDGGFVCRRQLSIGTKWHATLQKAERAEACSWMQMTERDIRAQIVDYLRKIGAVVTIADRRPDSHNRGKPDLTVCYRGRYLAFEVKRPRKFEISKEQPKCLEAVRAAGGVGEIVNSLEAVREIVEGIK